LRWQLALRDLSVRISPAAVIQRGARHETGGTHHIEYARREAEKEKYRQPPRRDSQQAIEQPANAGTDQDACNEFA
jgi:hypothetical protein